MRGQTPIPTRGEADWQLEWDFVGLPFNRERSPTGLRSRSACMSDPTPLQRSLGELSTFLVGELSIADSLNVMRCGPQQAFETLVDQSQRENRKLRDIAADIVARAQRKS
jgi:hypothetical protein